MTEFSRSIRLDDIDADGVAFDFQAEASECAALARRFGLVALERLSVEGVIRRPGAPARFRLQARLVARVVQECVVTLEAVTADIDSELLRTFDAAASSVDDHADGEIMLSSQSDSIIEPVSGDAIDVGEAAAEQLSLDLDPFPRAPGVQFDGYSTDGDGGGGSAPERSPFARLYGRTGRPRRDR